MLKVIYLILFIFFTVFCHAQGSWNIGYIKAAAISKKHIGQQVRIDFKSEKPWLSPDGQRHIRSYVGMQDTGILTIDTTTFIMAEKRKIYVDHGSYRDQYLECISCDDESLFVYDAEIVEVDDHSILFRLNIERRLSSQTHNETRTVRIEKRKLDGVMYKE